MTPYPSAAATTKSGSELLHILEQKAPAKRALQEELGWPTEPRRALLCFPTGVSDGLGGALLKELLPGLLQIPVQIVILGKGPASYGAYLTEIAAKHNHRLAILPHDDTSLERMLLASDLSLFLVDPSALPELSRCLRSGAVPVAPAMPLLKNYDPNQENGNAFLYEAQTHWQAFAAVVRALETYRFPYDWKTIQKEGMAHAS